MYFLHIFDKFFWKIFHKKSARWITCVGRISWSPRPPISFFYLTKSKQKLLKFLTFWLQMVSKNVIISTILVFNTKKIPLLNSGTCRFIGLWYVLHTYIQCIMHSNKNALSLPRRSKKNDKSKGQPRKKINSSFTKKRDAARRGGAPDTKTLFLHYHIIFKS